MTARMISSPAEGSPFVPPMASMLDQLRKRLSKATGGSAPAAPKPLPKTLATRAPAATAPDDVLRELGSTAGARTDAETLLAEATYNLKRGNREKDPTKKLGFFQEALVRFERLHQLLPGEKTIQEQVLMLRRGVEEIESVIARYAEQLAAIERAKNEAGSDE